jgi:hypothetical protein
MFEQPWVWKLLLSCRRKTKVNTLTHPEARRGSRRNLLEIAGTWSLRGLRGGNNSLS